MIMEYLEKTEALLEGHFLLSSGKHSEKYIQCAKLLQYPDIAEKVVKIVAKKITVEFDTVIGPAMGGIVPAYILAKYMNKRFIFSERSDNLMSLRRGFGITKGEKFIIMEDVITTGKSSLEVRSLIESYSGELTGFACIANRGMAELNLPVFEAIQIKIDTWDAQDCPLCKSGSKAVKPGSRGI